MSILPPPHNVEAEQATLGSMMLTPAAALDALTLLRDSDFYRPTHGHIFNAIANLQGRSEPVDLITLQEELRGGGKLDECGGTEYLMACLSAVPSAARVMHYATIVKDKSKLRSLIAYAHNLSEMAHDPESESDGVEGWATTRLLEIGKDRQDDLTTMRELTQVVYNRVDAATSHTGEYFGPITGIHALDKQTLGFEPGVIVVAARPSHGKTALLLQIVRSNPGPWLFFAYESFGEALCRRMVIAKSDLKWWQLKTGKLTAEESPQLVHAMGEVSEIDCLICDTSPDIGRMMAIARRTALKYALTGIMIDYLQLIPVVGKFGNREQEVAHISRSIRALVKELHLPVIVAAQLNRMGEDKDRSVMPRMKDLRESGQIEADADYGILIHNPRPEPGLDRNISRTCTILLDKQREGPTDEVQAMWNPPRLTFADVEKERTEE